MVGSCLKLSLGVLCLGWSVHSSPVRACEASFLLTLTLRGRGEAGRLAWSSCFLTVIWPVLAVVGIFRLSQRLGNICPPHPFSSYLMFSVSSFCFLNKNENKSINVLKSISLSELFVVGVVLFLQQVINFCLLRYHSL